MGMKCGYSLPILFGLFLELCSLPLKLFFQPLCLHVVDAHPVDEFRLLGGFIGNFLKKNEYRIHEKYSEDTTTG